MTTNQRLKELLYTLDITATELAAKLNVTKSTISSALNGNSLPSSKVLMPLGDVFNVNINWLLLGQGEMFIKGKQSNINKTDSSNERSSTCVDVDSLKDKILLLEQSLKDKEEIIRLLKR